MKKIFFILMIATFFLKLSTATALDVVSNVSYNHNYTIASQYYKDVIDDIVDVAKTDTNYNYIFSVRNCYGHTLEIMAFPKNYNYQTGYVSNFSKSSTRFHYRWSGGKSGVLIASNIYLDTGSSNNVYQFLEDFTTNLSNSSRFVPETASTPTLVIGKNSTTCYVFPYFYTNENGLGWNNISGTSDSPVIINDVEYFIGDTIPTAYNLFFEPVPPTLTINSDDSIIVHIDDFDDFTLPTATATDIIDGDISNLITKSGTLAKLVGEWYVDYKVCNSLDLCTTKRINITVSDGYTNLVLLADRAVMFIPKNYQTFNFNDINFEFFNRWTYVFYDLDNKEILEEGIANSILDYNENDTYKYFKWKYNYLLSKNIHFGILFTRYGDISLNGVVRYKSDIYNYRTYTEWNSVVDNIDYIDYDGSEQNSDINNIEVPTLQDNIKIENSFFNDFNTDFFGLSDIILLPLNFLNNLTSNNCVPYKVHGEVLSFTFPCMSTIYEESFPDLLALFRLITDGVISYYVIVNFLRLIKNLKDPENDKIEVYNL